MRGIEKKEREKGIIGELNYKLMTYIYLFIKNNLKTFKILNYYKLQIAISCNKRTFVPFTLPFPVGQKIPDKIPSSFSFISSSKASLLAPAPSQMAQIFCRVLGSAQFPQVSWPPPRPAADSSSSAHVVRCRIRCSVSATSSNALTGSEARVVPWGCEIESLESASALQRWLSASGLPPQKLEIQRVDVGERGLVALNNIRKGEKLLFVPPSLVITADSVMTNLFPQNVYALVSKYGFLVCGITILPW